MKSAIFAYFTHDNFEHVKRITKFHKVSNQPIKSSHIREIMQNYLLYQPILVFLKLHEKEK